MRADVTWAWAPRGPLKGALATAMPPARRRRGAPARWRPLDSVPRHPCPALTEPLSPVSRRKKKCVRYIQGEGSCLSPPSSDGSLLDSPPPSPHLLGSPPPDAKPPTEQTQPLSLSLKPDPLAHLSMMPPPPALLLAEAAHGKAPAAAVCPNGALDLPPAALQPPLLPSSSSIAQPSTSSLHSHSALAGTQPQPLSLVTKSLE